MSKRLPQTPPGCWPPSWRSPPGSTAIGPAKASPEDGGAQVEPSSRDAWVSDASSTVEGSVAFFVQWVGWDGDEPKALRPFAVPDEISALVCVEAMPRPILSATAYRLQRDPLFGKTRTILAYRRNLAWEIG